MRSRGGPDPGSRDEDRPRPRHPRGERGLRQGRAGVEPGRPREARTRHRLGRPARRRPARRRAEVPGLSCRSHPQARRFGRLRAAPELEGMARLPHPQPAVDRPARADPRRELRLQRNGARRHSPAAAARPAGPERGQRRAPGRGRQGLCRQIFPGLRQGRGPEDGRQHQGRLRPPGRGDRLDGALDQGRGAEGSRSSARCWRAATTCASPCAQARRTPHSPGSTSSGCARTSPTGARCARPRRA